MNVNVVIGSFYPAVRYGGPIFSTLYLSRELARSGVRVFVSTTNCNGDSNLDVETNKYIQFEENLYVKYYGHANSKAFSIPYLLNLWRDIKSVDIVFLQPVFSSYVPVTLLYARLFKKIVVLSPRGSLGEWSLRSGSRYKPIWLKTMITPFSDLIFWHSTSEQESVEINSCFKNAKIICIPNGIVVSDFANANIITKKEFLLRFTKSDLDCKRAIISMGRLHKKKGFDILINAFDRIRHIIDDSMLFIAGQYAGEKDNLIKQIKSLRLEQRVFLLDPLSSQDKIDFLANGDIFVMPSHNENFGIVYAEDLASGTPIIASKNTPWSDAEKYGFGKWIDNNPDAVANAIISVLSSDYKSMGELGRKYIHDNYDWKHIAKRFKDAFELILKSEK
jgi:glycosyltransferase involved in cell wall biosynthesis